MTSAFKSPEPKQRAFTRKRIVAMAALARRDLLQDFNEAFRSKLPGILTKADIKRPV